MSRFRCLTSGLGVLSGFSGGVRLSTMKMVAVNSSPTM